MPNNSSLTSQLILARVLEQWQFILQILICSYALQDMVPVRYLTSEGKMTLQI